MTDGGPARPFLSDAKSMMVFAMAPRLRHTWHFVHSINHEPKINGPLGGGSFRAEYLDFSNDPGIPAQKGSESLVYSLPL